MNLFTALKQNMSLLVAQIPENWKAIIHGKIAEANLAMPEAAGDVKRSFVVDSVHALTGAAKGFLHGVVHLLVEALKAKTPDVLDHVISSVETAVDSAADSVVDTAVGRLTSGVSEPAATLGKPQSMLAAIIAAPTSSAAPVPRPAAPTA